VLVDEGHKILDLVLKGRVLDVLLLVGVGGLVAGVCVGKRHVESDSTPGIESRFELRCRYTGFC
jgi:hypothetical protein